MSSFRVKKLHNHKIDVLVREVQNGFFHWIELHKRWNYAFQLQKIITVPLCSVSIFYNNNNFVFDYVKTRGPFLHLTAELRRTPWF